MTRLQRVRHLLAGTMREIGILVLVFAPLESTFGERSIDAGLLLAVMAVSIVVIGCGILIETKD